MSQHPQHPRLSFAERDAETSELFRRLALARTPEDSEPIVEEIVHLYLDLCASMAGRYDGRGVEHDDLVQVARLALVKAVRRYEPGHAPSFAAYAVPTISGELKRWFRDRGWVVRPPRRLQELRVNLQSIRAQLEQELGATPSDTELAAAVGVEMEAADDRVCLSEALTELDDDERELLLMRYVEGMTQREIGEARGVSQMQVSRTLRRITVQLHDHLAEQPAATEEMNTA